jgi:hypothetical protein
MSSSREITFLGVSGLGGIHPDQPLTLRLAGGLTVLWGESGSSKSTLLQGLELLAEAFARDPQGARLPLLGRQGQCAEHASAPFYLGSEKQQVEYRVLIERRTQRPGPVKAPNEDSNEAPEDAGSWRESESRSEGDSDPDAVRVQEELSYVAFALTYAQGRHSAQISEPWEVNTTMDWPGTRVYRGIHLDDQREEPYLDLIRVRSWELEPGEESSEFCASPVPIDADELWQLAGGREIHWSPAPKEQWSKRRFDPQLHPELPVHPLDALHEPLGRFWFLRNLRDLRSRAQEESRQCPYETEIFCRPLFLHSDGSKQLGAARAPAPREWRRRRAARRSTRKSRYSGATARLRCVQ